MGPSEERGSNCFSSSRETIYINIFQSYHNITMRWALCERVRDRHCSHDACFHLLSNGYVIREWGSAFGWGGEVRKGQPGGDLGMMESISVWAWLCRRWGSKKIQRLEVQWSGVFQRCFRPVNIRYNESNNRRRGHRREILAWEAKFKNSKFNRQEVAEQGSDSSWVFLKSTENYKIFFRTIQRLLVPTNQLIH